jgi:hypothetical protein
MRGTIISINERTAKILLIVSASGTVILYAAVFLLLLQLMKPI